MRTRILHLADLHLGDGHDYLGPASAERRREADGLLARITEEVLSPASSVGGVVIAGDLFEVHDPPAPLVDSVLRDLHRLNQAGIRILTVPGNHDEYSYPTCVYRRFASQWPDTLVTRPTPGRVASWELSGIAVDLYSMAFTAGRSRPPYDRFEVTDGSQPQGHAPARRIAVLHGSLDVDWGDRSIPLHSEALGETGFDYVALGHIHRPMERRLGRGWICYPGRIEGGGFDDPGGADLVTIDLAREEAAPLHAPCASARIEEEWNLSGLHQEGDLDARMEDAADPARILRLRFTGLPGFALQVEKTREKWGPRFRYLEIVSEEGRMPAPLESLAQEKTVRGLLAGIAARRVAEAESEEKRLLCQAALRHALAAFDDGGPQ
jgi:exonuclease SbcD